MTTPHIPLEETLALVEHPMDRLTLIARAYPTGVLPEPWLGQARTLVAAIAEAYMPTFARIPTVFKALFSNPEVPDPICFYWSPKPVEGATELSRHPLLVMMFDGSRWLPSDFGGLLMALGWKDGDGRITEDGDRFIRSTLLAAEQGMENTSMFADSHLRSHYRVIREYLEPMDKADAAITEERFLLRLVRTATPDQYLKTVLRLHEPSFAWEALFARLKEIGWQIERCRELCIALLRQQVPRQSMQDLWPLLQMATAMLEGDNTRNLDRELENLQVERKAWDWLIALKPAEQKRGLQDFLRVLGHRPRRLDIADEIVELLSHSKVTLAAFLLRAFQTNKDMTQSTMSVLALHAFVRAWQAGWFGTAAGLAVQFALETVTDVDLARIIALEVRRNTEKCRKEVKQRYQKLEVSEANQAEITRLIAEYEAIKHVTAGELSRLIPLYRQRICEAPRVALLMDQTTRLQIEL